MNINDLTPAPWRCTNTDDPTDDGQGFLYVAGPTGFPVLLPETDDDEGKAALQLAALARNDLDVQMRRGWSAAKCTQSDSWVVLALIDCMMSIEGGLVDGFLEAAYQEHHPVGLLTKADKWYKENVEAKPGQDGNSQSKQ